jgi:RNA-binding protein Musashi
LFVGALNQETTEETLESYFKKYGEILECTIMKDSIGKKSRGFGFITFKDPGAVRDILKVHSETPIVLDQKAIDPKLAVPRKANKTATPQVRRIFIGGLSSDTDEEDMKEFFSKFGKIEEAQLMFDKHTNRHRGQYTTIIILYNNNYYEHYFIIFPSTLIITLHLLLRH